MSDKFLQLCSSDTYATSINYNRIVSSRLERRPNGYNYILDIKLVVYYNSTDNTIQREDFDFEEENPKKFIDICESLGYHADTVNKMINDFNVEQMKAKGDLE